MLVMVLMDTEPIVGTLGMRWEWDPDPSQATIYTSLLP